MASEREVGKVPLKQKAPKNKGFLRQSRLLGQPLTTPELLLSKSFKNPSLP
jgi:hypothetical protein